jgi:hypothetical protein
MRNTLASLCALASALTLVVGCGSSSTATPDSRVIKEVDAAVDAPVAPDCFAGTPTTHEQLINACPAAGVTRIIKHPNLPLLNADGTLPPLP